MLSTGTHPRDRLFVTMMVGTGVIGSAIVLVALYLLTASLDRHATEGGNKELSLLLTEWTDSLSQSVENYASSGIFYDASATSDLTEFINIGGSIDWVAILDGSGDLVYEFNLPVQWDAGEYFTSDAFRPVLDDVVKNNSLENAAITGTFNRDGNYFLAATTQLDSGSLSDKSSENSHFVIGGRNVGPSGMERIAASTGSSNVSFSDKESERAIALYSPLGASVFLTWEAELPGVRFRQDTLPWLSLICAIFVLLTGWMATYFRRLATGLEKMHEIATTDQLTGVANRAALMENLQNQSLKDDLESGQCAVISLDLNDFKRLNDDHGHRAGDAALRIAAERIRASLRNDDKVIRMGGDEFVCLVFDRNPMDAAQKVANRLNLAFNTPMDLGGRHQIVTASMGIAISNGYENWDAVFDRSDAEMYRAKRSDFERKLHLA